MTAQAQHRASNTATTNEINYQILVIIVIFASEMLKTMETKDSNPSLTSKIPPGELLGKELKARKIRQKDFARQVGMQASHLSALIHGARNVTPLIAQRIEHVLGIPARFWLSLQADYELRNARPSDVVEGYDCPETPVYALAEPASPYASAYNPVYAKGFYDGCEQTRNQFANFLQDAGHIDLKGLRQKRKLTQEQLAIICNMDPSQIGRLESGEPAGPETITRILDAMGYTLILTARSQKQAENETESLLRSLSAYKRNNAKRYGIETMGLFGSYARGEQTAHSDIDVIIRLSRPSLYLYSAIQADLQNLFKKDVDIVSSTSRMSKEFKEQLHRDAIYV